MLSVTMWFSTSRFQEREPEEVLTKQYHHTSSAGLRDACREALHSCSVLRIEFGQGKRGRHIFGRFVFDQGIAQLVGGRANDVLVHAPPSD